MNLQKIYPTGRRCRIVTLFVLLLASCWLSPEGYAVNYRLYIDNKTGYVDVGPSGGVIRPYFQGGPLPGVGTRFEYEITLSPITSLNPGTEYYWVNPTTPSTPTTFLSMDFPLTLYQNLPAQNTQSIPKEINGYHIEDDLAGWLDASIDAGNIVPVAQFTLSFGDIPQGLTIKGGAITLWTDYHYISGATMVSSGYFNRLLNAEGIPYGAEEITLMPGETVIVQLVPLVKEPFNVYPSAWLASGRLDLEVIPEPSTFVLCGMAFTALTAVRWCRSRKSG